ncbi:hypothetical protein ASF37_03625 [Aeromicrobium sp. Leaf289]|nr:hypothetical protein ASF37_03625 [Aeromicrobium sp. Leaf289]
MSGPTVVVRGPVVDGAALPFACVDDAGVGSHDQVVKKRAIRCALSRICGVCGSTLARPIAFVGSSDEALDGEFAFPPCHEACAREVAGEVRQRLGRPERPRRWVLVTTAGFDLVRPARRGEPVSFRPNSVLARETLEP